ncbi:MAG: uroporphyrinogen-III synthase [Bacteroidota bacterium]
MPGKSVHILCTRPVDTGLIEKARSKNISIDVVSFIETEPILDIETQQEVEWASVQEAVVVFTSMNAVVAVTDLLEGHIPSWRIYCMGHATQKLVATYFGEDSIAGTGDHAVDLADTIIENEASDEVIFFCGNQRRDELPAQLRKHTIDVNEIMVYETIALNHKIEKEYNGILFFSPSAVESFFANNTLPDNTILFAIGNTTRDTAAGFCKNAIVVSRLPGKEELMEQAIAYFA